MTLYLHHNPYKPEAPYPATGLHSLPFREPPQLKGQATKRSALTTRRAATEGSCLKLACYAVPLFGEVYSLPSSATPKTTSWSTCQFKIVKAGALGGFSDE